MMSPLSVSSFPDLPRSSPDSPSMQSKTPARASADPSRSIRTRRRPPTELSLKSTDLVREGRQLPTLDLSPSSPLVFRRPSAYAHSDGYTHTPNRAAERERTTRSTHRGRLSVSSGMSTSPETASFPPTPQSTKDTIVSLGLGRAQSRSPSPDANSTLCMGSWIDRTLHIPLPPLPDVKPEEGLTSLSSPIHVRLPDLPLWTLDAANEPIEFAKPSPTDSSFSMSPVSPTSTSSSKGRFFDVRAASPSREEPSTYSTFASPMCFSTINPYIAVTPASPLSSSRSTETMSSPSGRSWFRSRGKSVTSLSDAGVSPSASEDDLGTKEHSTDHSERFRFLKKMSSQKTISRRPPLSPIDWDADTEEEMTAAESLRSVSPEPSSHSPPSAPSPSHSRAHSRTPFSTSPTDSRPESRTSAISFAHSSDSDTTSRSTSPFSWAAASLPQPTAETPRKHHRRRSVEVAVATATIDGDVVEARDIEDVIPTLRLLRGPVRTKLW